MARSLCICHSPEARQDQSSVRPQAMSFLTLLTLASSLDPHICQWDRSRLHFFFRGRGLLLLLFPAEIPVWGAGGAFTSVSSQIFICEISWESKCVTNDDERTYQFHISPTPPPSWVRCERERERPLTKMVVVARRAYRTKIANLQCPGVLVLGSQTRGSHEQLKEKKSKKSPSRPDSWYGAFYKTTRCDVH